jgi:signal peptidase II
MRRANSPQGNWWNVVFFLIALLVVIADQLSKIWIRFYTEGQLIFEAGFFRLTRVNNTGAAFGVFQDQSFFLIIVDFIGIVLVLLFVFLVPRRFPFLDTKPGRLALGLVLGGTIGNLVDRLRFGYVTDFVSISIWPAFNVADSAITVGVILFACFLLFSTTVKKPLPPGTS